MVQFLVMFIGGVVALIGLILFAIWFTRRMDVASKNEAVSACRTAAQSHPDWTVNDAIEESDQLGIDAWYTFKIFEDMAATCRVAVETEINGHHCVMFVPSGGSLDAVIHVAVRVVGARWPVLQLVWDSAGAGIPDHSPNRIRTDWVDTALPRGAVFGENEPAIRRLLSRKVLETLKNDSVLNAFETAGEWVLILGDYPNDASSFTLTFAGAAALVCALVDSARASGFLSA